MEYLIEIGACTIGSLGYALMYNVKNDKLLAATIGGFFTIATYIIANELFNNIIIATTLASSVITFYSEILARKLKSPATVFLLPGIIPLVPGGGLFYTMTGLLTRNTQQFQSYGMSTLQTAVGIALGVILASLIVHHINKYLQLRAKKNINNSA